MPTYAPSLFPSLPTPSRVSPISTPSTSKPGQALCSFQRTYHARNPHHPTTPEPAQPLVSAFSPPEGNLSLLDDWPHLLQVSIGSKDLHLGLAVHAFLVKSDSQDDVFPGNNLINMYSKFGRLDDAQTVFDEMPIRNTITWTSLISGYAYVEDFSLVLRTLVQMNRLGEKFNGHTCAVVLQACHCLEDCVIGEQLHGFCIKSGHERNVVVATSLASMYLRCGCPDHGEMVLDGVIDVDVRCLNLMISEHGKMGNECGAFQIFCHLRECRLEPDDYTFTNIISACGGGSDLGRQLHGLAVKYGVVCELSVGNAIVTMYGKHGVFEDAKRMFQGMREPNIVSWTAIISSYVKNGHYEKAIDGFVELCKSCLTFDCSCLATVLCACAHMKDTASVNQIHGILVKLDYLSDVFIATALVDAYAKCRNPKSARQVFNYLPIQNVAICNAILVGCSHSGALEEGDPTALFNWMRLNGVQPDRITCTQILSSSADQASIAKGKSLHAFMVKSGFEEDIDVGNSVISMYARCGSLEDAFLKFTEMASHDSVSWNTMISGFAIHGMGEEALLLMEKMETEGSKPDGITLVSILQGCSYSGLLQEGFSIYHSMEKKYGIKPSLDHQVCMVDLLGRAGDILGAMEFVKQSEFSDSPLLWRTLVNVCKLHSDLNFGVLAAEHLLHLTPADAASHILVSNMCAEAGLLEKAAKVRVTMHDRKMRKEAGCSWIEIEDKVHKFVANGNSHKESIEICDMLDKLSSQMKLEDTVRL